MSRSTRSKVVLGAATALALATAGWLGAGAAIADDTPTPAPSDTSAPVEGTDQPTDPPAAPKKKPTSPLDTPDLGTQPAGSTLGNSFSSPIKLTGPWNLTVLDNTSATVQSGEPQSLTGGFYNTRTQWIKFKSTRTGTIAIRAYGVSSTDDLGINVFTGSSLSTLSRKASGDESYWPVDGAGVVSSTPTRAAAVLGVDVKKDRSYYIQVGSASALKTTPGAAISDITVLIVGVDFQPSNDLFIHAKELKLGSNAHTEANAYLPGSSIEVWEPIDNNVDAADVRTGSVWFKWKAPQTGHADFGTCGIFDAPALGLFGRYYTPGGYGELASLGFDQGTGCNFLGSGGFINNQLIVKGEWYYLQVSKTDGSLGQVPEVTIDATFSDPYIEKLSKTSGHAGTTLVITGQALNAGGAPTVKFGSKTATIVGPVSATSITVKVPSHSLGKVDVTVTADGDTSNKRSFTYIP